jgi:hypothetical protein
MPNFSLGLRALGLPLRALRLVVFGSRDHPRSDRVRSESSVRPLSVYGGLALAWPAVTILADADAFGSALIVITRPRRSAVRFALLGSVADQLVRQARPPVLLLRRAAA